MLSDWLKLVVIILTSQKLNRYQLQLAIRVSRASIRLQVSFWQPRSQGSRSVGRVGENPGNEVVVLTPDWFTTKYVSILIRQSERRLCLKVTKGKHFII